ncbi:smad nuclear interacting protein 1-like [Amphibalanus amphitrite]|uniref:smad nuclear interacting protein 1-like n=1 Tax=Amphibalanus amphitrite TaxID=1232801 RepID=UPI001C917BE7|nr:smad nuclear interacting protein 1-like [Amphibalanus amphitrite]
MGRSDRESSSGSDSASISDNSDASSSSHKSLSLKSKDKYKRKQRQSSESSQNESDTERTRKEQKRKKQNKRHDSSSEDSSAAGEYEKENKKRRKRNRKGAEKSRVKRERLESESAVDDERGRHEAGHQKDSDRPSDSQTTDTDSRRDVGHRRRASPPSVDDSHSHRDSSRRDARRRDDDHRRRQRPSPSGAVRVKQEPVSEAEDDRRRPDRRERHDDRRHHRRDRDDTRDRSHHRDSARDRDRHRERGGEPAAGRRPQQQPGGRQGRCRWDDDPPADGGGERWGLQQTAEKPAEPAAEKELPNFGLSGKLIEDTNTCNGVVVKYTEPPEARKPRKHWRLYVFKGEETMPTLHIHRQSAFLLGRDRKVADIPIDHPSCSKQHAALQYRLTTAERSDGTTARVIRPYIIDLDSANGTYVNNKRIDPRRYVEIMERDVLKFGFSSREYVLLHESSQADSSDAEQ